MHFFKDMTRKQTETVAAIADRAVTLARAHGVRLNKNAVMMDIGATHSNGCKLKLTELLEADDGNFGHDVFGINRHINRETGQLEDCFLPRYSA